MDGACWAVLTAVGRDRPGLVDELTGWLFELGGNVEDSRMALLGGEFAVILLARLDAADLGRLEAERGKVEGRTGLAIAVRETVRRPGTPGGALPFDIELVGLDHRGIVHRMAHLLAGMGVNVIALETQAGHAPVTGVPLFTMKLRAEVPEAVPVARFRDSVQRLADDLNVDVSVRPVGTV